MKQYQCGFKTFSGLIRFLVGAAPSGIVRAMMREIWIVSAARTPMGSFMGALTTKSAPQLGSVAIREAIRRAGIDGKDVSEVYMGCVLTTALGQAPARQASLGADIPNTVPCTTIGKVCGSGLKAVMLGVQAIASGEADVVVAGGMESMSNAPYALPKAREGFRLGDANAVVGPPAGGPCQLAAPLVRAGGRAARGALHAFATHPAAALEAAYSGDDAKGAT